MTVLPWIRSCLTLPTNRSSRTPQLQDLELKETLLNFSTEFLTELDVFNTIDHIVEVLCEIGGANYITSSGAVAISVCGRTKKIS